MHGPCAPGEVCAVEGCGRPCHGRSELCSTHKARRLMNLPLHAPIRGRECDPEAAARRALEAWYEALESRRMKLDEILRARGEMTPARAAMAKLAEVEAEDEAAFNRAQARLRKAMYRYALHVQQHPRHRTPKHKSQARRRR